MRQSKRFAPLLYYGGHIFLLFDLDREAIKPAQSKLPLEQFQCDALEAATRDRIVINGVSLDIENYCTLGSFFDHQ
ncbi:hypothetical protein MMB85_005420 [Klebsiella quasipneumoniae]|nr:hypothetical protein [Klebsiella quasipneumoniae]